MPERFDAVVMGAGPAGEVAVSRLAKQGLRVLRDTVAQFPTYSEAYLKAIEALEPA